MRIDFIEGHRQRTPFGVAKSQNQLIRALARRHLVRRYGFPLPWRKAFPLLYHHYLPFRLRLAGGKCEVIHVGNHIYANAVPPGPAAPVVVACHDLLALDGEPWQRSLGENACRRMAAVADEVIVPTAYVRRQVVERLGVPPERVTVVHHGVDREIFRPRPKLECRRRLGLPAKGPFLLYVGSDQPRKRTAVCLEVLSLVLRNNPSACLLKVGDAQSADGRRIFGRHLASQGLAEAVRVWRWVNERTLGEIYSAADVFLFPSLDEGFGLPPLEAMASGLPVVATAAPAVAEVVAGGGQLHHPDDIAGMAEAVLRLLDDADMAERWASRALDRSKDFDWDRAAHEVTEVYLRAIARKGAAAKGAD